MKSEANRWNGKQENDIFGIVHQDWIEQEYDVHVTNGMRSYLIFLFFNCGRKKETLMRRESKKKKTNACLMLSKGKREKIVQLICIS